jgi:hypothetical protein
MKEPAYIAIQNCGRQSYLPGFKEDRSRPYYCGKGTVSCVVPQPKSSGAHERRALTAAFVSPLGRPRGSRIVPNIATCQSTSSAQSANVRALAAPRASAGMIDTKARE